MPAAHAHAHRGMPRASRMPGRTAHTALTATARATIAATGSEAAHDQGQCASTPHLSPSTARLRAMRPPARHRAACLLMHLRAARPRVSFAAVVLLVHVGHVLAEPSSRAPRPSAAIPMPLLLPPLLLPAQRVPGGAGASCAPSVPDLAAATASPALPPTVRLVLPRFLPGSLARPGNCATDARTPTRRRPRPAAAGDKDPGGLSLVSRLSVGPGRSRYATHTGRLALPGPRQRRWVMLLPGAAAGRLLRTARDALTGTAAFSVRSYSGDTAC